MMSPSLSDNNSSSSNGSNAVTTTSSFSVGLIQSLLPTTALGISGLVAASALILRAIKRAFFSPTIVCKLKCPCGKIRGIVRAKFEDSIRINCYCDDCRRYANYITQTLGKQDPATKTTTGSVYTKVVQVCKSAVTITQGRELLGLARKGPPETTPQGVVYMHRFYATCCHVPLMNTVDFLGFVGIFRDFLDTEEESKFDGPVRMFPELALSSTTTEKSEEPEIWVPDFLWKLIRYMPWRKCGPFDYTLQPVYWGSTDSNTCTIATKPQKQ